ncbi:ACP S-malonyltransferase [Actinoplanes teichomyceticus]|uniref:Malonyl CoA-acyl carrier protein transacylase n=1 Tax=Actinoplanes teichomyceticus TaxID=1867 RepID=A0A561VGT6_ACTTI|nr:ACP S-malonyltransferase [Actinoplanes teichomyceticus]TWG10811.1 [acyl-carrier-protein] S-malonyltransferase [Actinoplanes teichomyceticus]GIF12568.1 malonyl CoA-acyl carrier protein transacylase [Actinoplanes teichomyceticus]
MNGLVFPGQGVQRKGMGGELFDDAKDLVEEADELLGYSIVELCLQDPDGRLADTRYAQPAIYFVNALAARERTAATTYDWFAGHSLGEYNALHAAGVFDLMTGLRLVAARGELMAGVTGGAMAAVTGLPGRLVEGTLRAAGLRQVYVANRNSDRQTVIAGDRLELRRAIQAVREAGAAKVTPLPVSGPFHTPLMAPAAREFTRTLSGFAFAAGHTPVMSSVTADVFDPAEAAGLLSRQIAEPVEWVRTVRALRAAGVTDIDEVNGTTLTTLMGRIR